MYPLTVGVVIETKQLWDELQSSLQELSVRVLIEQSDLRDWDPFLDKLERMGPDIVLLDVVNLREPLEEVVKRIRSTAAHPLVFALNTVAEPNAILAALRAGASEYLFPPLADQVPAALERAAGNRRSVEQSLRAKGRTIGVLSAKGGCGATTIACHLAREIPIQVNGRALLADLDLDSGMVAFLMKSKSAYSIADACNNLQRLDASYWRALISNGFHNLEIIAAPSALNTRTIRPEQLKQIVAFARTQYDWTVIDLGRNINAFSLAALEAIDETYLVTTMDVAALHQAKQIVATLVNSGYERSRLRLLVNRAPKRSDLTLDELSRIIGIQTAASLPEDYDSLQESYAGGQLMPENSNLGRHFRRLAGKITGTETSAERKRFSLFG